MSELPCKRSFITVSDDESDAESEVLDLTLRPQTPMSSDDDDDDLPDISHQLTFQPRASTPDDVVSESEDELELEDYPPASVTPVITEDFEYVAPPFFTPYAPDELFGEFDQKIDEYTCFALNRFYDSNILTCPHKARALGLFSSVLHCDPLYAASFLITCEVDGDEVLYDEFNFC